MASTNLWQVNYVAVSSASYVLIISHGYSCIMVEVEVEKKKKGFLSSRKVDIQKQEKATQKIYLITEHSISFKHNRFTFLTIIHRMKLGPQDKEVKTHFVQKQISRFHRRRRTIYFPLTKVQ